MSKVYTGQQISNSSTTGWMDWNMGDLWLLPHGILRVPLGFWNMVLYSRGSSGVVQAVEDFGEEHLQALIAKRRTLWVPRESIAAFTVKRGLFNHHVQLQTVDGRTIKLMWRTADSGPEAIEDALKEWVGQSGQS